jgi:hypothetical protein
VAHAIPWWDLGCLCAFLLFADQLSTSGDICDIDESVDTVSQYAFLARAPPWRQFLTIPSF